LAQHRNCRFVPLQEVYGLLMESALASRDRFQHTTRAHETLKLPAIPSMDSVSDRLLEAIKYTTSTVQDWIFLRKSPPVYSIDKLRYLT
jgi:hypothetical protein